MKIQVPVIERRYGYVEVEVPEGSPILDPNASSLKKRRAAKKLGEEALIRDISLINWGECEEGDLYVDLSYFVTED